MKQNLITQAIADPTKNLLIFLIFGTFGLAIASDSLSELVLDNLGQWMQAQWGLNPIAFRVLLFAGIVIAIWLFIVVTDFSKWLVKVPVTVEPQPLLRTELGLIVVVSKTPPGVKSAAAAAIEYHWIKGTGNLKHCWLICGGQESLQSARTMLKELTGSDEYFHADKFDFKFSHPDNPKRILKLTLKNLDEKNVDNPNATFNLVNKIYKEAEAEELEAADIIADYTGGTKSMTAGLVLASCASPERQLQFMRPGGYKPDGRADTSLPSVATEVQVNYQLKSVR